MTSPPEIPLDPNFARPIRRIFGPGRIHLMTWQTEPEIMTEYLKRCREEGKPVRCIYVVDSPVINAFAHSSGRVAITTGFLAQKTPQEVAAILGHEEQHLHWTQRLMKWAVITGITALIPALFIADKVLQARGLLPKGGKISEGIKATVTLLATPIAFISGCILATRRGEYDSDAAGARFGGARELARDLKQIEGAHREWERRHPAPEGEKVWREVLDTHPPTAERIARLEQSVDTPAR